MVYAMASIAFLGFLVWSHHMSASSFSDKWCLNFAVCWNSLTLINTLNSKNFINYTWSAGNQFYLKFLNNYITFFNGLYNNGINIFKLLFIYITLRSSETIRKISNIIISYFIKFIKLGKLRLYDIINFDNNVLINNNNIWKFNKFNTEFNKLKNKEKLSNDWLTWFIGFTEGDGAILCYNNTLRFVLTQKESKILYEIKHILNMGTVKTFNKGNEYSRLIISNPNDIYLLTLLFNGNLVINHRINQLNNWINILNNYYKYNLIFINKSNSITLNDAWISGFTDAEGCFNTTITKNKRYSLGYIIKLRFILDQKDKNVLNSIQLLFNTGKVILRNNSINNYRYTITGFYALLKIYNYINRYPLKTNKQISFNKWSIILNMILNKEHLNIEGFKLIKELKKNINKNNSITHKIGNKNKI